MLPTPILSIIGLAIVAIHAQATAFRGSVAYLPAGLEEFGPYGSYYYNGGEDVDRVAKRDDQAMPGVLRFGKRGQSFVRFGRDVFDKKDMPGVLRFGKRADGEQEKKNVPGVLRFGKRGGEIPGVLRFGKRDADMPGVLRFGKKSEMPGVLRFGKRDADMPGVLRFGK